MVSLASFLLGGCSGASAPPAAPPSSSPSAAGEAAAPSAGPSSTPPAAAPEPLPADAPPTRAELGKRFRQSDPLSHVAAYAVDEACLLTKNIPPKAPQSSSIGLTDLQEGGLHWASADTNSTSAKQLAELRAFVGAFPKNKGRFVITMYEWGADKEQRSGWRALCLKPKPLFGGTTQIGRIKHKDGTYDEDTYRVGLAPSAIKQIEALPREVVRLAILWDDDLLLLLPVDKLKELKNPALTLAPMPPP
jgi:hypothetical protein